MSTRKAPARRATPRKPKAPEKIKLDVACGQNKAEGYVGIDLGGDADIAHDLFVFPWPIADDSVGEVRCSHFVEHIPHRLPGIDRDVWWEFFDELYRVCAPGARLEFWHPWARSDRAWWDPTHERAIADQTWYYLSRDWRQAQGLDHYPVVCDFWPVTITGMGVPETVMARNDEYRAFAHQHYANVYADLHVILECRKGDPPPA